MMRSSATSSTGGVGFTLRTTSTQTATSGVEPIENAKVHTPSSRSDWIPRARLVQLLDRAASRAIVLVAAPAGFGKSTAVAQWLGSDRAPARRAWVSLDEVDNDATRMWSHLAAALGQTGCDLGDDPEQYVAAHAAALAERVVPWVLDAIATLAEPLALVLDDCHLLVPGPVVDQLQRLLDHLPVNAHLILISRSEPALRLGRLRVAGHVTEIRTADLAFDDGEITMLLRSEGVVPSGPAMRALAEHTEGWPAAIYLAALSMRGRSDPDGYIRRLSGSDRYLADYLTEEILNRLSTELRRFVLDAVLFDRFCAALCDELIGATTASRQIHELERTNLFCTRIDESGTWFRFHPLFASFARTVAEREDPARVRRLHARGAAWFAAHRHVDEAVRHELAAGRAAEAAVLINSTGSDYFDAGRTMTVIYWLRRMRDLPEDTLVPVAATGAWLAAMTGQRGELQRRLAILDAAPDEGPLPDGSRSARSAAAVVRAMFGFDGPSSLLAAARLAIELESHPQARWYAVSRVTAGHAAYLVGDLDTARRRCAEATESGVAPRTIHVLALSLWSLAETEAGHAVAARELAERAMAVVRAHAMGSVPQVGLAFSAIGAALLEQGDLAAAETVCAEGLRVRRENPGLSPWPMLHQLLVCARLAVEQGRGAEAKALLVEAESLLVWDDDPASETSRRRIAAVRALLPTRPRAAAVGDELTPREHEVLRRLTGTQSLQEIAVDLYVSRNTVKTITASLYRKLGAHGREDAVTRARRRALI